MSFQYVLVVLAVMGLGGFIYNVARLTPEQAWRRQGQKGPRPEAWNVAFTRQKRFLVISSVVLSVFMFGVLLYFLGMI